MSILSKFRYCPCRFYKSIESSGSLEFLWHGRHDYYGFIEVYGSPQGQLHSLTRPNSTIRLLPDGLALHEKADTKTLKFTLIFCSLRLSELDTLFSSKRCDSERDISHSIQENVLPWTVRATPLLFSFFYSSFPAYSGVICADAE